LGHVAAHWDELLRFATSIRTGTVTASAMLRRLSAYPRQNGLALALRELGRLERSIFMLDWLRDIDLRRRTQAGLNKGEARNALARALFFNQLGELRDRRFENQTYRASGLNLLVAAIILWNTRYLEMALADIGTADEIARHIAPLGWEHISLTGDYSWNVEDRPDPDALRPLRAVSSCLPRDVRYPFALTVQIRHFRVVTPERRRGRRRSGRFRCHGARQPAPLGRAAGAQGRSPGVLVHRGVARPLSGGARAGAAIV
jgi:hypothetical protein